MEKGRNTEDTKKRVNMLLKESFIERVDNIATANGLDRTSLFRVMVHSFEQGGLTLNPSKKSS